MLLSADHIHQWEVWHVALPKKRTSFCVFLSVQEMLLIDMSRWIHSRSSPYDDPKICWISNTETVANNCQIDHYQHILHDMLLINCLFQLEFCTRAEILLKLKISKLCCNAHSWISIFHSDNVFRDFPQRNACFEYKLPDHYITWLFILQYREWQIPCIVNCAKGTNVALELLSFMSQLFQTRTVLKIYIYYNFIMNFSSTSTQTEP